jgi:hypothetical protein
MNDNPFYVVCYHTDCLFNFNERCTKTHVTIGKDGVCTNANRTQVIHPKEAEE